MAVVQALGIVEQTNALLNSRDTMPIKPTTNQGLFLEFWYTTNYSLIISKIAAAY